MRSACLSGRSGEVAALAGGAFLGIQAPRPEPGRVSWDHAEDLYLEVIGRPTGSTNASYLVWKIREAQKGRIPLGPRKNAHREGVTFKVLPLRMESAVVDKLDEAWRSRGIKNRTEFFRGALGYYLKHLGADDAAALFTNAAAA